MGRVRIAYSSAQDSNAREGRVRTPDRPLELLYVHTYMHSKSGGRTRLRTIYTSLLEDIQDSGGLAGASTPPKIALSIVSRAPNTRGGRRTSTYNPHTPRFQKYTGRRQARGSSELRASSFDGPPKFARTTDNCIVSYRNRAPLTITRARRRGAEAGRRWTFERAELREARGRRGQRGARRGPNRDGRRLNSEDLNRPQARGPARA